MATERRQDDKLDKLINQMGKLISPMESTLVEIKASNSSRKFIMGILVICTFVFLGLVAYSVNQINSVVDSADKLVVTIDSLQERQAVYGKRLDELIGLAQKNASTPEIAEELEKIRKLAAQRMNPIKEPSTDQDTD